MSDHSHAHDHSASESLGVESDADINVGMISALGIAFGGVILVIFLVMHSLFVVVREEALQEQVYGVVDPRLLEMRAHEAEQLGNYKALDKAKGVYQIPIDQAMALTVSKLSAASAQSAPAPAEAQPAVAPAGPEGAASPEGAAPAAPATTEGTTGAAAAPGASAEAPAGGAH